MNYLVHLFLCDGTRESVLGNIMADFIKGPIPENLSPRVRRGVELHRKVDAFANDSESFRRSKARIDDSYRCCKAVLVDVFYDHFLAKNWGRHATVALEDFAREVYRILQEDPAALPEGLQRIVPRMVRHNWFTAYRDVDAIGRVLERIASRLTRSTPIGQGLVELKSHYAALEGDCDAFLVEAVSFVEGAGYGAGPGVRRARPKSAFEKSEPAAKAVESARFRLDSR